MPTIPPFQLALSFIPVAVVIAILYRWSLNCGEAIYAVARMVLQLLAVGYVLIFIFDAKTPWIVLLVLSCMLVAASWIALGPIKHHRRERFLKALVSIGVGGVLTLFLVTQFVLRLDPYWDPRYVVPIAGMIFANSMNCVSLASERFEAEIKNGQGYLAARGTAMRAALIPITNTLFSVGIVSFPGMMTGQILSGTSPLVAVRYQIMVMSMVFGAGGIAAACYLRWLKENPNSQNET